ncbi:hypothetical protein ABES02_11550 [Neobacillus pocheonensis]|uniref:hypothetical protein n=1 Tax=Neobacillus pocheonensis TaxID=363869 RepID=UPI003D2E31AB
MFQSLVMSLFLYFPEDKSEYIPAAITFFIFFIGALVTMRLIIVHSKREAQKTKDLEDRINNQHTNQRNS